MRDFSANRDDGERDECELPQLDADIEKRQRERDRVLGQTDLAQGAHCRAGSCEYLNVCLRPHRGVAPGVKLTVK